MRNYNPNEYISVCCDLTIAPVSHEVPTVAKPTKDPFVHQSLLKSKCLKHRLQQNYDWLSPPALSLLHDLTFPEDFNHAACASNVSLNFYAMDSARSQLFARQLGLHHINATALALVDIQSEEQFTLHAEVTPLNISECMS
jgi:hypothetical protein